MKVPFLELKAAYRELEQEINEAVHRVLNSGWYILGEEVEAFEREFATYVDARHCIGVGNGLDALQLALRAMEIGPGDEVIVPANTFIGTWLAVSLVGAIPVPVEPADHSFNIALPQIEAAVTERTRAIIPVHLYGLPVDLDPIIKYARQCGLWVLEDAAQAHGARYRGRRIGAHGDLVAWSFYPGKNLGAMGDGGAVTTDHPDLAERLRQLRNYGSPAKYVHEFLGVNSRLDPIQAAVLRVKLKHLDTWNQRRRRLAELYLQGLAGLDLALPVVPDWAEAVWHLFVVRTEKREEVINALAREEVQTMIHYPLPPHLQGAYQNLGLEKGTFPAAEKLAETVLSLPLGPQMDQEQVEKAVRILRKTCS